LASDIDPTGHLIELCNGRLEGFDRLALKLINAVNLSAEEVLNLLTEVGEDIGQQSRAI
jgi:hypothetical protein